MFQKRGRGDSSSARYSDRGKPAGRGRGPGRWNSVSERFSIIAENEKVPEFVPGSAGEESGTAESKFSQEQLRAIQHMQKMEEFNRGRVRPPPPEYTDPSDYRNYRVSDQAINFPAEHDYTQPRPSEERRRITLSPEAQEYEKNATHNANLEEIGNRMFYSVMDGQGQGQGGRKKRKYTTTIRQKKQRRRRRDRHSTKKYKK
jgi:hypothetical protein